MAQELAAHKLLSFTVVEGQEHLGWWRAAYQKHWWEQYEYNPFLSLITEWTNFNWDLWAEVLREFDVETESTDNLNHALLMALHQGWVVTAKNGTLIKAVNTDEHSEK